MEICGQPAARRLAVRQARSRPEIEAMRAWLDAQLPRLSKGSGLDKAIGYVLRHWGGLTRFLDDGRIEFDTNTFEREIRRIPLGRKNALFAGNDTGAQHWALMATLIGSAKLNGVEPLAWITDVLERIIAGRTKANEADTGVGPITAIIVTLSVDPRNFKNGRHSAFWRDVTPGECSIGGKHRLGRIIKADNLSRPSSRAQAGQHLLCLYGRVPFGFA